MEHVYTFWEGQMPAYIDLCLKTWQVPYTVLNYNNLRNYIAVDMKPVKRFTLPQIADFVRVHVLEEHGGYWLDADTIMITGDLPNETIMGNHETRINSIGFLHTEAHSDMFTAWKMYQDSAVFGKSTAWNVFGNAFTDPYLKEHTEVSIHDIRNCFPETYMVKGDCSRYSKYQQFYFSESYGLQDLEPTPLLMLHNSWTPDWYKRLTASEILTGNHCTMSNILRAVL